MRILLVFRGNLGPAVAETKGQTIPEVLSSRGTSHPSEVNSLLVAHWLQADHGHSVDWYCDGEPSPSRSYLLHPTGPTPDLSLYDAVLAWKVQGVHTMLRTGMFDRLLPRETQQLALWFDAGGLAKVLTDEQRDRITHIAWGTQALADSDGRGGWPGVQQGVVEHATGILRTPDPRTTLVAGLYVGRLPTPYLNAVVDLSASQSVHAYALSAPGEDGEKLSLRPGHDPSDLDTARRVMARRTDKVVLYPAANMTSSAELFASYLFGLVPPTRANPPQRNSASKAWDCWGLGLPVVMGDNTPEADHVRASSVWLGELYSPAVPGALEQAAWRVVARFIESASQYHEDRRAIQAWCHSRHTYRDRARELNDVLDR